MAVPVGHRFKAPGERTADDCMICQEPCEPMGTPGVYSNQEGAYPVLLFHGRCGSGYTGEFLRAIYLDEVKRRLVEGGAPLLLN